MLNLTKTDGEKDDERFNFTVVLSIDDNQVLHFETSFFDSEFAVSVATKTSLKTEF